MNLYPGEYVHQQGPYKGQIHVTPAGLLSRVGRYQASLVPKSGSSTITDGGITEFEVGNADFLESLVLNVQMTIATNGGTYTTATFAGWPNPVPYGVIKRISLSANGGQTNLFSISGWGLYKYCRQRSNLHMVDGQASAHFQVDSQKVIGQIAPTSQTRAFAGGTVAASTTYSFHASYLIPVAFNKFGDAGLLVLQSKTPITLKIEWANLIASLGAASGSSDIITQTNVSGTAYTLTGSVYCQGRYIRWLPDNMFEYRDQVDPLKAVIEYNIPLVAGTVRSELPRNQRYNWIMAEPYNAGAQMTWSSLSNIQLTHTSGRVVISSEDAFTHVTERTYLHDGLAPIDCGMEWDLRRRSGVPGRLDLFDTIDDEDIQSLALRFDNSTALSGTSGVNVLAEVFVGANQ